MQSDRNSFCGNVVLDSVNMKHKDEDSIMPNLWKQLYPDFYYEDFSYQENMTQHFATMN